MKGFLKKIFFSSFFFFISAFPQSNIKTWTETSVQDFSNNQLNNLIIANRSGGEVKLVNPLVKIVNDYNDDTALRFISKDSAGNYLRTWIDNNQIYVRKYNSLGEELSAPIKVNELQSYLNAPGYVKTALFNDGAYIVIWTIKNDNIPGSQRTQYGQLFKNDSVKVGSNIELTLVAQSGTVFANENDGLFWVMYTNMIELFKSKIVVQKINKNGALTGGESEFTIIDNIVTNNPAVIFNNNDITIAWGSIFTGGPSSLLYRKYNLDGSPKSSVVIVSDTNSFNRNIDLCYDDNNNLIVVWDDIRNIIDSVATSHIYGQIFDSNGIKVGDNILLDSSEEYSNSNPNIEFLEGEFLLSWIEYDYINKQNHTFLNKWKLVPVNNGEMISNPFYVGKDGGIFNEIMWNSLLYENTNIKLQLRSGNTLEQLNNSQWLGPQNSSGYYENSNGEKINQVHSGDKYIQYKALFNTKSLVSPVLNSVLIKYYSLDSIPPLPPSGFKAESKHSQLILSWQPNNENDLAYYKIYRGLKSNEYEKNWKAIIPKEVSAFEDTTAQVGQTYYYVITAVDSSLNESSFSDEISGASYGVNFYVNINAGSEGDGSFNNPFKTIQQGINASINGDTVKVLPGIYSNSFTMKYGVSLAGTGVEECTISVPISAADNCVIKGFTLTKSLTCKSASPIITENIFRGASEPYTNAIQVYDSSSAVIIKNFITEYDIGIRILIHNRLTIKNNIIKANEVAIQSDYDDKITLINNTLVASRAGISLYPASLGPPQDSLIAQNNIIMTTQNYDVVYCDDFNLEQHLVKYNDFWNSYQAETQVRETNLFLNPQFVNADLQDFHLVQSSPCINSGNPDPIYNDVDGSRNDMGAYGGPDPINAALSSRLTKSIIVSSLSGYPGDTISVYVSLDNTTGLAGADFLLAFDPVLLSFYNAELTEATKNFTLVIQQLQGKVRTTISSNTGILQSSGEIVKINFIVNMNSKTNDASALALKEVSLTDMNLESINIRSITDGAFVVNNTNESSFYIYVDSKNTGFENGSRKNPFNTIMEAVNIAKTGDTIFVSGGNYYEQVIMKDGISLAGSGPSVTNIITNGFHPAVTFYQTSNSEISGFNIKADEGYVPSLALIECTSSSPIIKKNRFEAEPYDDMAIYCSDNSEPVIENNYLKKMCIAVNSSNPVIKNNVIESEVNGCITTTMDSDPVITGNKMYGCPGAIIASIRGGRAVFIKNWIYLYDIGWGVRIVNADSCKFFNNIFVSLGNSGTGLWIRDSRSVEIINNTFDTNLEGIDEETSSANILNNIIVNNSAVGIKFSGTSNMDYNDFWNNYVNYEGNQGSNNIVNNPIFIDTAKHNYLLSASSPCINAGNPDIKYNDIDGSRNDIGAYGGPYADSNWINPEGSTFTVNQITTADTFLVKIIGEKVKGTAEIDLTISYDPSILSVLDATSAELTKSFSLQKNNIRKDALNLCLKSNKGISEEKGELVDLYLIVNSKKVRSTLLHFDSALVKDEATYLRNVLKLKDGEISIITGIKQDEDLIPTEYSLSQNYPNPFNPTTNIRYEIPIEGKVTIKIYDILGREITTLVNNILKPGRYEIKWNAVNYASGVYFYQIKAVPIGRYANEFISTKKLIILK